MGPIQRISLSLRRGIAMLLGRAFIGTMAWAGYGFPTNNGFGAPPLAKMLPASGGRGRMVNATSYRETIVRTFLDWSPDDLRVAQQLADQGNIIRAADLCERMRGDDRVSSVLRTRVLALLGAPLTFEVSVSGRLRRRALKAAQAEEDWWGMLPDSGLEDLLTWRMLLGVAIGELVWTEPDPANPDGPEIPRIRNGRNVPRVKVWHPRWLRFDFQSRRWLLMTDGGKEIVIRPGDGKWVLLTAGSTRPWSKGLWRGLGVLWLLKEYARDDWSEMNEKFAKGVLVAKSSAGSTTEDRQSLAADLRDMGRDGVIVLPEGFDFSVAQLSATSWETYQAQITLANTSMAITVVGSDLPSESKKGAGTGANLQQSVRQDYLEADANAAEGDLHEQVLQPWAEANFGDADVAPFPCFAVAPPEDRMQLGQALQAFTTGLKNLEDTKYRFVDVGDFEEQFGFNLEEKPEEDIKPPPVAFGGIPGVPGLPPHPVNPALPGTPAAPPAPAPAPAPAAPKSFVEACEDYAFSKRAPLTKAESKALGKLALREAAQAFAGMWQAGGGRRFQSTWRAAA
jgi:hypothetical protein